MQISHGYSGQQSTRWGAALRSRVAHAGGLGLLALMMAACSLESSPGASAASGNTALSTRSQHLVNNPPTANNDAFTVPQDSADTELDVLANDICDPEWNHAALTVVSINDTHPNGGTVTLSAGRVHFTPSPGFHGVTYFVYIVADGYGLTAAAGVAVTVTPTSPPPAAPVLLSPDNGAVLTRTFAPQGTAAPFTTVTLFIDGLMSGTAVTDESGHWSTTIPAAFPEGAHLWKATATDGDGRTSSDSETRTFSINPIAAPVLLSPAEGELLCGHPLYLEGTSAPFSRVSIFIDGSVWSTEWANESGIWSFSTFEHPSDGVHQVKATAGDDAGHTSPDSETRTFSIDCTPPPAPVVTAPANGSVIPSSTFTFTGTAEPNSTVFVFMDDVHQLISATSDSSGNWSSSLSMQWLEGTHRVQAFALDATNNISNKSPTITFTVQLDPAEPDTTITSAPVCASGSRSATFEFGSNVPRVTFECSLDGAPFGACSTPMTFMDLSVGGHTLRVRARDSARTVDSTPASYSWNAGLGCASTAVVSVRVR